MERLQDTVSILEELKSTLAAVRESQEKMWRAIKSISKEVHVLVLWDVSTNDGEDTEPMPAYVNLAEKEPAPTTDSSISP